MCFGVLRRRLEQEQGGQGVREYIRVLRLLEKHSLPQLRRAVDQGLACGAISRDAIALFLYPQEEVRDQLFNLEGHPHLKGVVVQAPDLGVYGQLMGGVR